MDETLGVHLSGISEDVKHHITETIRTDQTVRNQQQHRLRRYILIPSNLKNS